MTILAMGIGIDLRKVVNTEKDNVNNFHLSLRIISECIQFTLRRPPVLVDLYESF